MQETNIQGNIVSYSSFKTQENPEILQALDDVKFQKYLSHMDDDIIVVLGGDGSMLEAISQYYPKYKKFFGINFGNKGFLLHPKSILEQEQTPKISAKSYPLISCRDATSIYYAFNELDIKAGDGKMLDLNISMNNDHSIDILGDGILISTPAGSTGYSSSLGGPILQHDMNCYLLTPKASWKPRSLDSIIISNSKKIYLTSQGRVALCEIYADGQISHSYDNHIRLQIEIIPQEIQLYIDNSYGESWDNKILEEQGFSQNKSQ